MIEFYRPAKLIRISKRDKARDGSRIERAIRLYCTQYQQAWNLQIRSPMGIGGFGMKDGKDDVIATATLSRGDLEALRDAIDNALSEV